jgi:hypothetical protein
MMTWEGTPFQGVNPIIEKLTVRSVDSEAYVQ